MTSIKNTATNKKGEIKMKAFYLSIVLFALGSLSEATPVVKNILCESMKISGGRYSRVSCDVGTKVLQFISATQVSRRQCIENQTYGIDYGSVTDSVWVSDGCRANVQVLIEPPTVVKTVLCESENKRQKTCFVGGKAVQVTLQQQLSKSDCTEGRTFNYTTGTVNDYITVDRGCRARFTVYLQP